MSTPTPKTSTSTSLSAHELREIVAEAKAWTGGGALINIPDRLLGGLSNLQEGYAEGLIAERLRGREQVRRLAIALSWHRSHIHRSDANGRLGLCWLSSDAEQRVKESDALLDEARKAGLLEGSEK